MQHEIIKKISGNKYKLNLGSFTVDALESALETTHEIEEFDIWLEIESDKDVEKLKTLFSKLGGNVQRLSWSNWKEYELAASQVVELLNNFKSLKTLKLSSWRKPFTGDVPTLNLPNLESIEISECGNEILSFLTAALPENTIKDVKIYQVSEPDEKFANFTKKQSSIERLDLTGDFNTAEAFTGLNLQRLRVIIYEKENNTDAQKEFLRTVVKSQPNLTDLDLLNDSDYSFNFVDDSLFTEIAALSKLENLSFVVDGLKSIAALSNLSALKFLQLKTNRDESLTLFKELADTKNSSIEKLLLNLWSFDIPAETYTALGKNFENLKSLKITLGTRHSIKFFAEAFPNLEDLDIRFGESNNTVEFDQVFDGSEIAEQSKLKNLRLQFWGSKLIDNDHFFKFLGVFTSLEKLNIKSKFPFSADFINQLKEKLGTIKKLNLSSIEIRNNETFPVETIEAFKALREKLTFVKLLLANIQHVDFGGGVREGADGESRSFTFEPLIKGLEGVYKAQSDCMANIRIMNYLTLTAGEE